VSTLYTLFKELPKFTNLHVHSSVLINPAEFLWKIIEPDMDKFVLG